MPKTQTTETTQATEETALSPARQSLKEAKERLAEAVAAEEKAWTVREAAAAELKVAETALESFAGLDDKHVASRLAVLRGEGDGKSVTDIRDAQRRRIAALDERDAALKTLQLAQQHLDIAHEAIVRERKVVESHTTAVLLDQVTGLFAMTEQADKQREALRIMLKSLLLTPGWQMLQEPLRTTVIEDTVGRLGLPCGYPADWQNLQQKVGEALAKNFNPNVDTGRARAIAYWKGFADAVAADPAAAAPPLPTAEELWG